MSLTPAIVIGATGYVGGEFLRLIDEHPQLRLAAAISGSEAGNAVGDTFAHLRSLAEHRFCRADQALENIADGETVAVFSAAPHGGAATAIAALLASCKARDINAKVVDASADFRLSDLSAYQEIYRQAHGAPELANQFTSALPEHLPQTPTGHIGHPGCFATSMLLAIVPLLQAKITDGQFFANGITGATGSGKTPSATTHAPERHSNLFAYKPLAHRHAPEVVALAQAHSKQTATLHFTPHSGPFARGIHMTINARNTSGASNAELQKLFTDFYAEQPFVRIVEGTPRLKNVVASNFADIGVATDGEAIVVFVVIDNLLKGAAGGCMQWMNRLLGFEQTAGLSRNAPGWT